MSILEATVSSLRFNIAPVLAFSAWLNTLASLPSRSPRVCYDTEDLLNVIQCYKVMMYINFLII